MWLGAYRTSRQWQDAKYVQLQGWDAGLTAPRTGRFAEGDEAEAEAEDEGADDEGQGVRVDDDDWLLVVVSELTQIQPIVCKLQL
jgi:hypothetical protein